MFVCHAAARRFSVVMGNTYSTTIEHMTVSCRPCSSLILFMGPQRILECIWEGNLFKHLLLMFSQGAHTDLQIFVNQIKFTVYLFIIITDIGVNV